MNKIPTAEETLRHILGNCNIEFFELKECCPEIIDECLEIIREQNKLYVKAALEAAAQNAKLKPYPYNGCFECGRDDMYVDKKSILNSYPENLIV